MQAVQTPNPRKSIFDPEFESVATNTPPLLPEACATPGEVDVTVTVETAISITSRLELELELSGPGSPITNTD